VRNASLAAVLITVAACAPAASPSSDAADPSLAPPDAPDPRAPVDVQALARQLAALRHLELKEPVRAEALDDASFRARFAAGRVASAGASRANGADAAAFWLGFGFASPSTSIHDSARQVLEEQIVGFYDAKAKALFVRDLNVDGTRIVPRNADDRGVLVHEIEHALQDQNFGIPLDLQGLDDDAQLARAAVYEGDAMLTMIAERALRMPATEHWVSRVTELVRTTKADDLVRQAGEHSKELANAPPLLRRRLVFPYVEGLVLMADVYRTGGMRLVDRVFSHPPRTTEQVLHPDKYVAGEPPVPVAAPAAPEGWRVVAGGTMGELQTGVLLAQCVPDTQARLAAEGWGGDSYAIAQNALGDAAILWSTAWDDEEAAERFATGLAARGPCLRAEAPGGLDAHIGREVTVLRDGKHVAYVQGLPAVAREPAARALLALPGDAPPAEPPLGDVSIPPLIVPEQLFTHRGHLERGAWRSTALGMRLRIPANFSAQAKGSLELLLQHRDTGAAVGFQVMMQSPGERLERAYLRDALKGLRAGPAFDGATLTYDGLEQMVVAGAASRAYTWRASQGDARVRLAFVPACGGKATVVIVLVWARESGWYALHEWLGGFALPAADSPACAYLRDVVD
jgi:hypothetical protein